MSRLKKDIQLTLLSRLPVMLLGFLSVVLLTRILGPEGNGVYTFTYAVLNLLMTVIGFQLDGTLTVFLAREKEHTAAVCSAIGLMTMVSVLTFGVVLTLVVFCIPGGARWVLPQGQSIPFFFGFMIIAFALRRLSTLMQATLRGCFKFKAFNAYMVVSQLIPALVYGLLLSYGVISGTPIPLLDGFKWILAVETLVACTGVGLVASYKLITFSTDFKWLIKPMATLSFNSILSAVGHFLNKRLDVWFVQFYRGTASLGQYGLATQIANFTSDAMTPFNQVLIPYIAEAPPEQHGAILQRTARLNMGIAMSAAILIVSTSWLLIPILFGNAFAEAIPATQVLAIGIIFISQRLVFSGYFKATNQMHYAVKAAWSGVIMTIILDIVLIPHYGILGAATATTLAYGTSSIYLVHAARKILRFHFIDILVLRKSDITWLLSGKKKDEHSL